MKHKAYPKYKNIKYKWVAEIPEHWDIPSTRWISKRYSGGTPDKDKINFWENGTIPWLNSGAVNQGTITKPTTHITKDGLHKSSAKWIPPYSIVIALAGQGKTKGTAAYTTFKTTCNQSMAAIVFDKDCSRYMYWWFVSQYKNIRGLASDEARDGLNLEMVGSIPCPRPTLPEQEKIASFLDYKTAQIDQLIEKKKDLIEKFNEKRIALITHAVTKGLDENVPMKDSGVEWLGEVPAHWELKRLKFLGMIKYGLGQPPRLSDTGLPLIRATNIESGEINEKDLIFVDPNDVPYDRDPVLKEDDIIIVRSGAYTADSAIIPKQFEGAITGYDMVFRAQGSYAKYVAFCLLSDFVLKNQLYSKRSRAAQPHLNKEELGETLILTPSTDEQEIIATYIKTETRKINKMLNINNRAIEHLKEYRTAIITAAVTGKIDVRNFDFEQEIV